MALRKRRTFVGGGKVIARKEVRKLGHELGCWRELKTFQDNLHIHAAYCKFCGLGVRVVHTHQGTSITKATNLNTAAKNTARR